MLCSNSDVIGILATVVTNDRTNIIVRTGIDSGNRIRWKVRYGAVLLSVVVLLSESLTALKQFPTA